eukprot:2941132-Rhodomonas_salina.1
MCTHPVQCSSVPVHCQGPCMQKKRLYAPAHIFENGKGRILLQRFVVCQSRGATSTTDPRRYGATAIVRSDGINTRVPVPGTQYHDYPGTG